MMKKINFRSEIKIPQKHVWGYSNDKWLMKYYIENSMDIKEVSRCIVQNAKSVIWDNDP